MKTFLELARLVEVLDAHYKLLHPRPAYILVSGTISKANAMAVSWVSPVSEEPPMICAALGSECYTLEVMREVGDFTVNVVPVDMLELIWKVGTASGRRIDKIRIFEIELEASSKVKSPHLAKAVAYLGAKVVREVETGDCVTVIGEVVEAFAAEDGFSPKKGWDLTRVKIPLHVGGRLFSTPGRVVTPRRGASS